MAKNTHQPQGELLTKNKLKENSRREEKKFPPIEDAELRVLRKVWARSLAEARHPHSRPPPFAEPHTPRPGGIASRAISAHRPHPENHERTQQSIAYWAPFRAGYVPQHDG